MKANFTATNNFFANKEEPKSITVAPKALTWDTSAITLNTKKKVAFTADSLKGSLALKDIIPGDEDKVTLTVEGLAVADVAKLTGLDVSNAGSKGKFTLTATNVAITGDLAENYQLPTLPEIEAFVNEVETLDVPTEENVEKPVTPKPGVELGEKEALTLEREIGISTVPDTLKGNKDLDTPAKIIGKLFTEIQKVLSDAKEENTATYDVQLMYSSDGGENWVPADDDKYYPITVVLPYPAGTTSGYTFKVAHMFTSADKAGQVETPAVTNTKDGIKFTVESLSPISVAWTKPTYSGGGGGGGGGNYSGDVWERIEKAIEKADNGDRVEAKVTDENMPISTMQALYDDGGVTLVIKWGDVEIVIPAGKALNPKAEAGRIYYPLSYLAEIYKGAISAQGGNPETGGTWVITAPVYSDPAPTESVPVPEAVEPTPEPEAPKAPETPTATAPVQPEEPVNSSSKVGTIVALLALMAAAAAGAYFLYKKRDDDGLYTK